jgi:hypothetical protein
LLIDHIRGAFGSDALKQDVPPPEDRDGWSSLDWNAWVADELFKMV